MSSDPVQQFLHDCHLAKKYPLDLVVEELTHLQLTFLMTLLVNDGYDFQRGKVDGKRALRVTLHGGARE